MAASNQDARHAQDLSQAEMGQQSGQPSVPVVQGVPVAAAPGAPAAGAPARGPVLLGAPRTGRRPNAWAAKDLPPAEVIVLNYAAVISCFACLDVVTTMLNGLSVMHGVWWGFYSFILLLGPICGVIGAGSLNRCLVGVYLAFCMMKVTLQIVLVVLLGMVSSWALLWVGFLTVIQFWIMKVVATFWSALGAIPPERRKVLAEDKDPPVERVYW